MRELNRLLRRIQDETDPEKLKCLREQALQCLQQNGGALLLQAHPSKSEELMHWMDLQYGKNGKNT